MTLSGSLNTVLVMMLSRSLNSVLVMTLSGSLNMARQPAVCFQQEEIPEVAEAYEAGIRRSRRPWFHPPPPPPPPPPPIVHFLCCSVSLLINHVEIAHRLFGIRLLLQQRSKGTIKLLSGPLGPPALLLVAAV